MKAWTLTAAAIAATLTLAGCTEDRPATITETEPETPEAFDPETLYESAYIDKPGGGGLFFQFVSEEAKEEWERRFAEMTPRTRLVPLSAERAAEVWDNKREVSLMEVPPGTSGVGLVHTYNYIPLTPKRRHERWKEWKEVRR